MIQCEHLFYTSGPSTGPPTGATAVAIIPYAELHAHTNFSFLDGASPPDDLVERAVAQGLTGLAVTDRNGLYGAVRFMGAAEEAGLHGIVGTEIELGDPAVPDPGSVVIPPRRRPETPPTRRHVGRAADRGWSTRPARDPSARSCPGIATRSRRTCAGSASGRAVRTSCCWRAARSAGAA